MILWRPRSGADGEWSSADRVRLLLSLLGGVTPMTIGIENVIEVAAVRINYGRGLLGILGRTETYP